MSRQDEQKVNTAPETEAYSLEDILAEYGRGGRQPAQKGEVPPAAEPLPEPERQLEVQPPEMS